MCLLLTTTTVFAATVDVTADNTDAHSEFHALGDFSATYTATSSGPYIDTGVQASTTTGADFAFSGWQKLSGYTNNNVVFNTLASGTTANMNNMFDNSNYVVQLERVDTSKDFLSASGSSYVIGWNMQIVDRTTPTTSNAGTQMEIAGSGSAILDSGQWFPTSTGYYGWGSPDSISAPDKPGYYTPVNTISATGSGTFAQSAYGTHSLQFNGFNFGAGSATFGGSFTGGMSGTYSMYAS